MNYGADAFAFIEVRPRPQDQCVLTARRPHGANGTNMAGDRRSGKSGNRCGVKGRRRPANQVGGLTPAGPQHQSYLVLGHAGVLCDVICGPAREKKRICLCIIVSTHSTNVPRPPIRAGWPADSPPSALPVAVGLSGGSDVSENRPVTSQLDFSALKIAILGGGPAGYEAAMVAASLGAEVTIVENKGVGGSAVLTDVVPSKTLIATADTMSRVANAHHAGVKFEDSAAPAYTDLGQVNERLLELATEQSADIRSGLERAGVRIMLGTGTLLDNHRLEAVTAEGTEIVAADAILIATGAHPRELPAAAPDGERIFNWTQLYNLTELPRELIVIGSGVTGAEFASAYNGLGSKVTLVSSRDQVLPGEDADAAAVLEDVFGRQGMTVLSKTRAESVQRTDDGVLVTLNDGRTIRGSHALLAVGGVPNTAGIGLEEAGVALTESGHIKVDGVSRTTAPNVYAAGDCTGIFALASVAAMQGRIAMAHLLGDSVKPLKLNQVASNIFTAPEIASVGVSEADIASGRYQGDVLKISLRTNPRAKMLNVEDGFVKVFSRRGSGTVIGGVVVGPHASELIFPLALAVAQKLNVDDVANTVTVYPSMTGSIAEAARRLHVRGV